MVVSCRVLNHIPGGSRPQQEHPEDEDGIGSGIAVAVASGKRPPVGLGDEDLCAPVRLAAADQVDDVEHIECPNAAQNHGG